MTAPEWFVERLRDENDGRLRIRWSHQHEEWQIEVRRGAATTVPRYVSRYDDALIRARDGYDILCAVRPGDRMPCRACRATVKVPCFEFGEARCASCGCRMRASYWPLSDALLEHLRYIDPYRGGHERIFTDVERASEQRERSTDRAFTHRVQDEALDWALDQFPKTAWDRDHVPAWASTEG